MSKKHVSRYFLGAALAAFLSFGAVSGCSDNNNNTATVLTGDHCADACERYAACFNASFDVNACESRCEAALGDSSISVETTQQCVDCIGANVCSSATYSCAGVCVGIIVID